MQNETLTPEKPARVPAKPRVNVYPLDFNRRNEKSRLTSYNTYRQTRELETAAYIALGLMAAASIVLAALNTTLSPIQNDCMSAGLDCQPGMAEEASSSPTNKPPVHAGEPHASSGTTLLRNTVAAPAN